MKKRSNKPSKNCDSVSVNIPHRKNNFRDALVGSSQTRGSNFEELWPKLDEKPFSKNHDTEGSKVSGSNKVPVASSSTQKFKVEPQTNSDEKESVDIVNKEEKHDEKSIIETEFPPLNIKVKTRTEQPKKNTETIQIKDENLSETVLKSKGKGISQSNVAKSMLRKNPSAKGIIKVDILEAIQYAVASKLKAQQPKRKRLKKTIVSGNPLDSDKPVRRKGKVRDVPKKKALSRIKKSIILSRRKRLFISDLKKEGIKASEAESKIPFKEEFDKSVSEVADILHKTNFLNRETQVKSDSKEKESSNELRIKFHSKKFRPYCRNMVNKKLTTLVSNLIISLRTFQDKLHERDPIKAKRKRRYVCGFKETIKFLHAGEIKLIIVATNLEVSVGDPLEKIISETRIQCIKYNTPIAFAGTSQDLGYWTLKKNRISIIGILNYQGSEDTFKELINCLEIAQEEYDEKIESTLKGLAFEMDKEKSVEELIKESILEKLSQVSEKRDVKKAEINHLNSYLSSVEKCLQK